MRKRTSGFTLIELMIVVAVVAILAVIALPIFNEQVRKSRRSEAVSAAGHLQLALERWRADHPSYANTAPASALYPSMPTSNFYTFALSIESASAYTVTATPKDAQAGDRCGVLTATANLQAKPKWASDACN